MPREKHNNPVSPNLNSTTPCQSDPFPPEEEPPIAADRRRGRGAINNRSGRFERLTREYIDDGWDGLEELSPFKTSVQEERAKTIISRNNSPDIVFDQSLNPYRGCEHGCVYCYARPTHCYLDLSAGLDFETRLFAKVNAPATLERELAAKNYTPKTIMLGANTDPYQPIERQYELTRQILQILQRTRHPVSIVTKSALVLRDIDILEEMAADGLAKVAFSVTSLDRHLSRIMEPRASTPMKRIEALRTLSQAGIPTIGMVAPIIPFINDAELETILATLKDTGIREANYILIRLPLEVRDIFVDWLEQHFPDRARRVMKILRDMRGGADYQAHWGTRMSGTGVFATSLANRFKLALKRLDINSEHYQLRTDLFTPPILPGQQMQLL